MDRTALATSVVYTAASSGRVRKLALIKLKSPFHLSDIHIAEDNENVSEILSLNIYRGTLHSKYNRHTVHVPEEKKYSYYCGSRSYQAQLFKIVSI